MKLRGLFFFGLPAILICVALAFELWIFVDHDPLVALNARLETTKQTVELNEELTKLFIGVSISVIGGVAYYIRGRADGSAVLTRISSAALVATLVSSVFSVLFGHLWLVTMRNQLAADGFGPRTWAMEWTERLQFLLLLASLGWFSLLVLEQELGRKVRRGGSG